MKKIRAFSIVELMISLSLFLICILFIIEMFPLSIRMSSKSRQLTTGMFLANEVIEDVTNLPSELITYTRTESPPRHFTNFSGFTYTVTKTNYRPNPNFDSITVKVTCPNGQLTYLTRLIKGIPNFPNVACNYSARMVWTVDPVRAGANNSRNLLRRNYNNSSQNKDFDIDTGGRNIGIICAIATDAGGEIVWLLDRDQRAVYYYNGTTIATTPAFRLTDIEAGDYTPTGITCSSSGKKGYVCVKDPNRVFTFDATSGSLNTGRINSYPSGNNNVITSIDAITTNSDGSVFYLADKDGNAIWYYSTASNSWNKTDVSAHTTANYLSSNARGNILFILNDNGTQINKFTPPSTWPTASVFNQSNSISGIDCDGGSSTTDPSKCYFNDAPLRQLWHFDQTTDTWRNNSYKR